MAHNGNGKREGVEFRALMLTLAGTGVLLLVTELVVWAGRHI